MKNIRRVGLGSERMGMFGAVNLAVAQWWHGAQHGYTAAPTWFHSPYKRKEEPRKDGWDIFFDRVGHTAEDAHNQKYPAEKNIHDSLITPRGPMQTVPPGWDPLDKPALIPLLPPENKHELNRVILDNFRIKMSILHGAWHQSIALPRPIVGMHIRGPLRIHGCTALMIRDQKWTAPPYQQYFEGFESLRGQFPGAWIYLATDSHEVVEAVRERYGDRVILHTACRPAKGEPHLDPDVQVNRISLGVDVLMDMLMLAACDAVVHGNSNLTNFLQAYVPKQEKVDIFRPYYEMKGWI